jgi:hypothetical protein
MTKLRKSLLALGAAVAVGGLLAAMPAPAMMLWTAPPLALRCHGRRGAT